MNLAAVLLLTALALPARSADTLVSFTLEDQHGIRHTDAAYRGKVVVLIGSDRGGSGYNAAWGRAVRDSLRTHPSFSRLAFLPVADLRGVPGWIRGIMKKFLPENRMILLDAEGRLAGTYAFVPDTCNIVVFTPDGQLVRQAAVTEVDAVVLGGLLKDIRRELQ